MPALHLLKASENIQAGSVCKKYVEQDQIRPSFPKQLDCIIRSGRCSGENSSENSVRNSSGVERKLLRVLDNRYANRRRIVGGLPIFCNL